MSLKKGFVIFQILLLVSCSTFRPVKEMPDKDFKEINIEWFLSSAVKIIFSGGENKYEDKEVLRKIKEELRSVLSERGYTIRDYRHKAEQVEDYDNRESLLELLNELKKV